MFFEMCWCESEGKVLREVLMMIGVQARNSSIAFRTVFCGDSFSPSVMSIILHGKQVQSSLKPHLPTPPLIYLTLTNRWCHYLMKVE
jgi:hypothetical protein